MSKIIIVEGPDRCFKTSAINHIRKNLVKNPRVTTIHCSSPAVVSDVEEWTRIHYLNLMNLISVNQGVIILDRSHLGEHVYGTLYREAKCSEYIFGIEKILQDMDVNLILLTDTIENRIFREDGLSQSKFDTEKMQLEHDLFVEAFNRTCISNKIHLHAKRPEEIIENINSFIGVVE